MDKIIRLDIVEDYKEIFRLSQYAFQYKLSDDEVEQKIEDAKSHIIYGYEEDGNLMAKLHLLPLQCNINGSKFDMGGLSSIASWPEYRRGGLVRNLIKKSLQTMKENNQLVSFLHPFSIPFYRKYGWEQVFSYRVVEMPVEAFRLEADGIGYVRRTRKIECLNEIYEKFIKSYSGNIKRSNNWWKYRVLPKLSEVVVAYDNNDVPIGYLGYNLVNGMFEVSEFVNLNENARHLLYSFIGNHDSMIDKVKLKIAHDNYLNENLHHPPMTEEIHHHFMVRIVDVNTFLKLYPFQSEGSSTTIKLKIVDDFMEENTGVYEVNVKEEDVIVNRIDENSHTDIECSVQQLSLMLIGNVSPIRLLMNKKIKGNAGIVEKLAKILERPHSYTPYLMDTF